MKKILFILISLMLSMNCFGQQYNFTDTIFTDTIGIREYIIKSTKSTLKVDPNVSKGLIKIINDGCNEYIPILKDQIDTYFILKTEYLKCKNNEDKNNFIETHKIYEKNLRIKLDNINRTEMLFNDSIDPGYLKASFCYCITNIIKYCENNVIFNIENSFKKICNKLSNHEKVYWSEFIKLGEYWGMDKTEFIRLANSVGFYKSNKGYLIYKK